jgi:hypothetical protein
VEEGTYYVNGGFTDVAADGTEELGNVVAPEVKVTKDTTVTLNAAEATEVTFHTPRPAERIGVLTPTYYREIDGQKLIQSETVYGVDRFYTNPTAPVTDGTFELTVHTQLVAPQLRAKTSGSSQQFRPYYESFSPVFGDRGARLAAVTAGTAQAPDFSRVRGKLAVLRDDSSSGYDTRELAQAAKSAGAKAVLLVLPKGMSYWTEWQPTGDRMALPSIRTSWADGEALLRRMAKGATEVDFTGTSRSPYLYDLMGVSKGAVPKKPVYTVTDRNTAAVRATYTRTGASQWASEQRFAWRPYQTTSLNQWSRFVPVGQERVEYVSAGDGTQWQHAVQYRTVQPSDQVLEGGMHDDPHTYQAGQHTTERWFGAVTRPAIPTGDHQPSVRIGDTLSVYVPEFEDSGDGHWSFAERGGFDSVGDTATAAVYRDGKLVAESDNGAWGDLEVPAGDAEYRLDLTTARDSADWHFAPSTHTSWTFRSDTTAGPVELPLLQVDYDVPVDAQNAVGPARTHTLGIDVRMQDGTAAPRGVALKVETSYDDGQSWTTARTARRGADGRFTATVERPERLRGDTYVTLRVSATDASGNSVQQTVQRAYLQHGTRGSAGKQ